MRRISARTLSVRSALGAAGLAVSLLAAAPGSASAQTRSPDPGPGGLTAKVVLSGGSLRHTFTPAGSTTPVTEPLTDPDDIVQIGNDLFVGFQNGVGPQGQASASGNPDSTIVELTDQGHVVGQWDITGKCDGLGTMPQFGAVVATVNEDANSSVYSIVPWLPLPFQVTHDAYTPGLTHNGGTDAVSVIDGRLLISASAPGTTGAPAPQPYYPAVYSVSLNPFAGTAGVTGIFSDEASARVANVNSPRRGQTVKLGLTDPDSNEAVPFWSTRFRGDFVLDSQGDKQQIYVDDPGGSHQRLWVLSLSQSIDDTAWPVADGTLYATDSTHDTVDAVTGSWPNEQPVVAVTPCGANSAPATCPAPPAYPPNYLGALNLRTGDVTPLTVRGAPLVPQGGLTFVSEYPGWW